MATLISPRSPRARPAAARGHPRPRQRAGGRQGPILNSAPLPPSQRRDDDTARPRDASACHSLAVAQQHHQVGFVLSTDGPGIPAPRPPAMSFTSSTFKSNNNQNRGTEAPLRHATAKGVHNTAARGLPRPPQRRMSSPSQCAVRRYVTASRPAAAGAALPAARTCGRGRVASGGARRKLAGAGRKWLGGARGDGGRRRRPAMSGGSA